MLKARGGTKFRNQWDIESMLRLITHLQLVLILRVRGHLPPFLVYISMAQPLGTVICLCLCL
jgi:hypothetical protein